MSNYQNHDISELASMLSERTEQVVKYLLPNARKHGDEMRVGSLDGEPGESLKVELQAPYVGHWKDWATGEYGDLVDLWAGAKRLDKGSAVREIRSYLGLDDRPPVRTPAQDQHAGNRVVGTWQYPEKDGIKGRVDRIERLDGSKSYRPYFRSDGEAGIEEGLSLPLYGTPNTVSTFVVEGEKCVDALRQLRCDAVTSQGGARAAAKSDWTSLAETESVVLIPDIDQAGEDYVNDAAKIILSLNPDCELSILKIPGLPPKGDIVDWIQEELDDWDGYSEDDRIRGLESAFGELLQTSEPYKLPAPRPHNLIIQKASDIALRPVDWLWPDRIPLGNLSIIAGIGGVGKSTIACAIAAAVTTGADWPFSKNAAPQGDVAWVTGEESLDSQVIPRLKVAGANLNRVRVIKGVKRHSQDMEFEGSPFQMSLDAGELIGLKKAYPELRLFIIDPLSAFLDAKDSHKDADVRQVFLPWIRASEETGVAVVFIAHHNKSEFASPANRINGSAGIRNAVRTVYAVFSDADVGGEYLFLPEKSNLSDCSQLGLRFRIESKQWEHRGNSGQVGCVQWMGETDLKADEVAGRSSTRLGPRDRANEFLREELADGSRPSAEIFSAAEDAGIAKRTIERAKEDLGIESCKEGTSWVYVPPA